MALFINDQEIVLGIKGTVAARDAALRFLFQDKSLRSSVVNYATANGGTPDDGKDLFQDAVVLFDRNIRADKFNGQSSLRTYFISIAKWHWVNMRRKKDNQFEALPEHREQSSHETPETMFLEQERKSLLEKALEAMGGRCMNLLNLYKLSYSMDEIAQNIGLSSPEMAKKEVYRCRERLRNQLNSQSEILTMLRNDR